MYETKWYLEGLAKHPILLQSIDSIPSFESFHAITALSAKVPIQLTFPSCASPNGLPHFLLPIRFQKRAYLVTLKGFI